jgi:hypothetical protein
MNMKVGRVERDLLLEKKQDFTFANVMEGVGFTLRRTLIHGEKKPSENTPELRMASG